MTESITEIGNKIQVLLQSSELLKRQLEIMTSIDGVDPQVAINTIISTAAFKSFDNGVKFACYIGVVPFSYSSGSSQSSRNKVSHRANKKLNTL